MQIRIGGVPEHFNYPWHMAMEEGRFANIGVDVKWEDVHGGTGEMCSKLRSGALDIAVVLTEGIIADIANGNPSLIVQKFVKSPLIWGIHTGANSDVSSTTPFTELKFAISRKGSGSHLMANVEARNRGLKLNPNQFVEVGNFDGAVEALNSGSADLLLWEKFTTKPTVDAGKLRRIGETVTPWPCFVIAARQESLLKHPNVIWNLLWIIRKTCRHFMSDPMAENKIAERYGLTLEDAHRWFNSTEWEQDIFISRRMLSNVVNTLRDVDVITGNLTAENMCWNRSMVY